MKPAIFHPKAREVIREFPANIRDKLGKGIWLLQQGHTLHMPDSRNMPSIAPGANELRIKGGDGIYRVFYYLKSDKGILVFHAFIKKTQITPALEIELGRKRLKEIL